MFSQWRRTGSLGSCAGRQELAVSTTHRLLQSLVDAGFLEKDDATSRYRIGAALAAYGQVSYRQHRIYLSEPYLEQLAATTGASASLAVRSGSEVVLLGFSRWREADGHVLQGVRLPLHASALGESLSGLVRCRRLRTCLLCHVKRPLSVRSRRCCRYPPGTGTDSRARDTDSTTRS